jgi:hypothetical protein
MYLQRPQADGTGQEESINLLGHECRDVAPFRTRMGAHVAVISWEITDQNLAIGSHEELS